MRVDITAHARITYVGKSQSCMEMSDEFHTHRTGAEFPVLMKSAGCAVGAQERAHGV